MVMVTATKVSELISKAENQLEIINSLHQMFDNTLDLEIEDMFLAQLAVYTELIQQVKVVNPQWVTAKLNDVLVEMVNAKAQITNTSNDALTWEKVSQVTLLMGIAKALGWVEPQPPPSIFTCEICGARGQLGVEIVERPYYDTTLRRDNTRYECKNIQACLTRTGR
jgi:hypothetical protein